MNGHENLKPLGSGKVSAEKELEIRRKGAKAAHRKMQERKDAAQLLNDLLNANVTNKELTRKARVFFDDETTADKVIAACVVLNECRKGGIDSFLTIMNAAGRADTTNDEAAHAALLDALTRDDPDDGQTT